MSTSWLTRAESEADIPTIREITVAAFSTPEEVEILDALRSDPAWIEGLSVVSTDASDVVVGHALLTRCHIGEAPALMLGPVAVRPDRQRSGAGSAAILAGLEYARGMRENHVVVVGDPKYYSRFGFTRASEFSIALAYEVPDDEVMARTLDPLDPLPSGVVRFADGFGM